jgi:hypothetical protein
MYSGGGALGGRAPIAVLSELQEQALELYRDVPGFGNAQDRL